MLRRFLIIVLLLVLSLPEVEAQWYIRRLKRWQWKGEYEKIVRKSNKLLKKHKKEKELYYYLSWAELKTAENSTDYQIGYSHLVKSIRYFDYYRNKGAPERIEPLSNLLHAEINRYYTYFEEKNHDTKLKLLDKVLVSIFGEPSRFAKNEVADVSQPKPPTTKEEKIKLMREQLIEEALSHVGKPYKYAGKGPDNFDCSGFTRYVYLTVTGHELPHSASMQSKLGRKITPKEAMAGDLIFFGNPESGRVFHAAIVYKTAPSEIGGVVHCINKGVSVDQKPEPTWEKHWKDKVVIIVNILDEIVKGD